MYGFLYLCGDLTDLCIFGAENIKNAAIIMQTLNKMIDAAAWLSLANNGISQRLDFNIQVVTLC